MPQILIDKYQCVRCGQCVLSCPNMLYSRRNLNDCPTLVGGAEDLCIDCAHCVAGCPVGAISINGVGQDSCLTIPKETIPRFDHISTLVRMRRSIRHFSEKLLEKSKVELLLDVVRWAPSARNNQLLRWIVVRREEKMKELGELVIRWVSALGGENAERLQKAYDSGNDVIFRGASTLVVACIDKNYDFGEVDATIAVQTLDFTATAMRLGTCWAGFFMRAAQNEPEIGKWLGLNENENVQAALMIGYSGPEAYHRIPYRKETDLHWVE